ncbi:UDP-glucuronic acid decarboxylase family protein [Devosia enhydra]|nr:UDP-glucuronic acid decarboxylase family protein [Devosia enhydra]
MAHMLVTGGAGFVGQHLCQRLLSAGHAVTAIDDLSTGSARAVERLSGNAGFTFVQHDVCHPYAVEADLIFNLACPASPRHYQADPIHTLRTSVLGAINALDLARTLSVPLVQASTSEVYGDPQVHPQHEDYWGHVNPIGPRSCYDEGKRAAETLCFDYRRMHGVDARIVRIFNTYGPGMAVEDGRVVSTLIIQALRGEPLTLFGDGMQTRSFCYVDDLVSGLIAMAGPGGAEGGPINLGNPGEFSMIALAERVLELTGSNSPIIFQPLPQDDPRQRQPDISRAITQLGWRPVTDLREGLQRTIDSFRDIVVDA